MASLTFDDLSIGDSAEVARTVSESDVYLFAGVSGDTNPAHLNAEYAKSTAFKQRIAHGALLGGYISAVLGNQLPGNGTIYMEQSSRFLAPVYFGDTITAHVEVIELIEEKRRVVLRTWCTNQDDVVVLDGKAMVSPPRPAK